jgi:hypothetical protein
MADASSVRKANSSFPAATGRAASSVRFSNKELWLATGTNYVPVGRTTITYSGPAAADAVDIPIFIADRAYEVVSIKEVHGTAGGAGAAVVAKKCTGTQAASAGAALHTGSIDLTATANTVITPTLTATAADLVLAAGDRVALDFSGTISPLAGMNVTVVLRAI